MQLPAGGDLEDLSHMYCCDPDVGLCSTDLHDYDFDSAVDVDDPDMCLVCRELTRCPVCGTPFDD